MIAYLDTQVVQWLMHGSSKKLTRDAKSLIDTAELLISPMVTLELELLFEIRRAKLSWREMQAKLESEIGLRICDLPFNRVAHIALGENWTRDPFDRIIVAHAKANGLAYLISADQEIRKHYQRAVW